jgi:hypothetical protein
MRESDVIGADFMSQRKSPRPFHNSSPARNAARDIAVQQAVEKVIFNSLLPLSPLPIGGED